MKSGFDKKVNFLKINARCPSKVRGMEKIEKLISGGHLFGTREYIHALI